MAPDPTTFSTLMQAMHDGSLVLTPNHRMSVQLLDRYGPWRRARGLPPVCPTPAVFPVDIWLRQLWEDQPAAQILEPALETLVWQDIVRESEAGAGIVNQRATARAVQEAWRRAHLWRIDMDAIRKAGRYLKNSEAGDDLDAFLSWVDSFEKFCRKQGLISLSPLVETVISRMAAGIIEVPEDIVLAGFGNPPPLYGELIAVLGEACGNVTQTTLPALSPATRLRACRDSEDEFRQAATWSKGILDTDPGASIGIICPDLHRHAATLERIFRDVLHPEQLSLPDNGKAAAFSISSGRSLGQCPLLVTAADILALNTPWVDTLVLCRLLRSPFIAGADNEESARASLEWRLRETGEMKVQLSWVRDLAGKDSEPYYCVQLGPALLEFDTLCRASPSRAPLQQWATLFEAQLAALGWPGPEFSDIQGQSQLKAWSRLLKAFSLVSHWHGDVSLESALATLQQLLATAGPGEADDDSPVRILTPTEADGLVFTHTRILGLTEQHWPPPARPAPFIPLSLQKEMQMPDSDANRQTELARLQLLQFTEHTETEIVFSYPCQEDDLVLKPAGMLAAIAGSGSHTDTDAPQDRQPVAAAPGAGDATEILQEDPLVRWQSGEEAGGGSALIADQADCPFRAFAVHRLHAEPLPAPVIGLPGHVLGSILHDALEIFWRAVKTQEQLLHAGVDGIEELVENAVSEAVKSKARFYRHTMTSRFNDMEIQRLKTLLMNWLEEEKRRGTFSVVASEYRLQWQHANLSLNLRIDRIDETGDGRTVIVDYKSPKQSEIPWFDPRQTEPQLMLYMMAVEAERASCVDGLFIAQVNVEETRYKGISNDDGIYPKSHYSNKRNLPDGLDWELIRQSWQESLTAIANEFLAGYAAVAPKNTNTSCTWCHLGAFCRIDDKVAL